MWATNKSQSSFQSSWESFGAVSLLRHICWSKTLNIGINSEPKYIATKKSRTLEAVGVMETGISTIINHSYEDNIEIAWWNSSCKLTTAWLTSGDCTRTDYLLRNNVSTAEAIWLMSEGLRKNDDVFVHSTGKATAVKSTDPMLLFVMLGLRHIPTEEWALITPEKALSLAQFEVFMRLGPENSIKIFENARGTDVEFLKRMLTTFSEDVVKWENLTEVF
jgi:hypothetical protein